MNIILFGPPGIGKSTIIGRLKNLGASAIDLEDLYPNRVRFQIPNMVSNTFLGGADLNPQRVYRGAIKVLLIANQDVYDARRTKRDSRIKGKANQAHHDVNQWKPDDEQWEYVIDTSNLDADTVATHLYSIMERRKEHEK